MSKKIILLGHGAATIAFIETFRQHDQESIITLFPCDGRHPYDRDCLIDVLAKELKPEDVFLKPEKWYRDQRVEVILDEEITRVNVTRKKVHTSAKQQLDYDHLFIADVPGITPSGIKGHRKSGVFSLDRWGQIDSLLQYLSFVDTAAIQVESFKAIKTAFLLNQHGKDVVLVFAKNNLFDEFDEETAKMLKQILEERNMRLIEGEIITEAVGESEIKAVRLLGGKIVAAEMVLFEQSIADMRVFSDEKIVEEGVFHVSPHNLKSDIDQVWAADYIAKSTFGPLPTDREQLIKQGEVVALSMLGQEGAFEKNVPEEFLAQMGSFSCGWFGQTKLTEGGSEFSRFDSQTDAFRKIYVQDGKIAGAMLINAEDTREKIQAIRDRDLDITGVESYVLESNFGVDDIVKMRQERAAQPTPAAIQTPPHEEDFPDDE